MFRSAAPSRQGPFHRQVHLTPMQTPANIARHPIHPMLVPIPIGLWVFSLICDLVYVGGWGSETWRTVAFYNMVAGVIGALIAAIPGLIDLLSLRSETRKTALIH